ncbi:hypothetical protein pb186bvf_002239 [Paramecium bursaria]
MIWFIKYQIITGMLRFAQKNLKQYFLWMKWYKNTVIYNLSQDMIIQHYQFFSYVNSVHEKNLIQIN